MVTIIREKARYAQDERTATGVRNPKRSTCRMAIILKNPQAKSRRMKGMSMSDALNSISLV
jgi:hypothetical protein